MKLIYDLRKLHTRDYNVFLTSQAASTDDNDNPKHVFKVSTRFPNRYVSCGHMFASKKEFKGQLQTQSNDNNNNICPKCKSDSAYVATVNRKIIKTSFGEKRIALDIPTNYEASGDRVFELNKFMRVKDFVNNAAMMKHLQPYGAKQHPSILMCYAIDFPKLHIMTLAMQSTLKRYTQLSGATKKQKSNVKNTGQRRTAYVTKLAANLQNALEYLHYMSVAHTNINPLTILVNYNSRDSYEITSVVIAAYENCVFLDRFGANQCALRSSVRYPSAQSAYMHYHAPEILNALAKQEEFVNVDLKKADMWSVGMTLLEFALNQKVVDDDNTERLKQMTLLDYIDAQTRIDKFEEYKRKDLDINIRGLLVAQAPETRKFHRSDGIDTTATIFTPGAILGRPQFSNTSPTEQYVYTVSDYDRRRGVFGSLNINDANAVALNSAYGVCLQWIVLEVDKSPSIRPNTKKNAIIHATKDLLDRYKTNFQVIDLRTVLSMTSATNVENVSSVLKTYRDHWIAALYLILTVMFPTHTMIVDKRTEVLALKMAAALDFNVISVEFLSSDSVEQMLENIKSFFQPMVEHPVFIYMMSAQEIFPKLFNDQPRLASFVDENGETIYLPDESFEFNFDEKNLHI